MRPVEARILRGLKIFVIEKKTEVKQFLGGLAMANSLYIQISSLDKGGTSAELRVAGAQRGIVLTAYCRPSPRRCGKAWVRYPAIARSQLAC